MEYTNLYDNNTVEYPNLYKDDPSTRAVPVKLSDKALTEQASKFDYAMRETSPGKEEVFQMLKKGYEPELRQSLADKVNQGYEDTRMQILREIGSKSPDELSKPEVDLVMSAIAKQEQDPAFSLESVFAKNWVNDAVFKRRDNNELMSKSFEQNMDEFLNMRQTTENIVTRSQAFINLHEKIKAKWDQQSWINWPGKGSKVADFAKDLLPFYNWYNIVNNIPGAPSTSIWPGTNKEQQLRYAYTVPMQELPNILKSINDLADKNLPAAMELSEGLVRYASNEQFVRNAIAGLEVAGTVPVGTLAKTGARLTEALATEARGGSRAAQRLTGALNPEIGTEVAQEAKTAVRPSNGQRLLLTDQRAKPAGLITDQRPGSEAYTKQGELFGTGSNIYTRQGEFNLEPPTIRQTYTPLNDTPEGRLYGKITLDREYTPVVDPKTKQTRFEMYGDKGEEYFLQHPVKRDFPRDERGKFTKVPKEQLELSVTTKQSETQVEAPLIGGKGSKPVTPVAADKVTPTSGTITKNDYLAASAAFRRGPRELSASLTRGETAMEEARIAFTDIAQAAATERIDVGRAANKMGDTKTGSVFGAAKEIEAKLKQADPNETLNPFIANMPHFFNPNIYAKAVDDAAGIRASELAARGITRVNTLIGLLGKGVNVERLSEDAMRRAIDLTQEFDLKGFKTLSNSLTNSTIVPPSETLQNAGQIKYWFGRPDKTAFSSLEEAYNMATSKIGYNLPEDGFTLRQDGTGYHIVITKPIRESFSEVKDHLIETNSTRIPKSWTNVLLSWARSADSLTSLHDTIARKVATFAPAELRGFIQQSLKAIQKLGPEERLELRKVLEFDRSSPNLTDPTKIGSYRNTVDDFEKVFLDLNNKLPTEAQKEVYQLTVQLNDFDYITRSLAWLRDLHRQGAELFRFHTIDQAGSATPSTWAMGRRVANINWDSSDNAAIAYWVSPSNPALVFHKRDANIAEVKQMLSKKISLGEVQVIEVGSPRSLPFKTELDSSIPVNYIVTDSAQFKPLKATDIAEYRPGGHIVYGNQFYLKQPDIRIGSKGRLYYYGDKTILGVDSEKEAARLEKVWIGAQNFLKENKDKELDAYLKKHLPMDITEFKKLYTGAGPGGGLDANNPVKWVKQNRDTFETYPDLKDQFPGMREQLQTPDMMRYLDKRFIAERGQLLNTARDKGTEANPMFHIEAPNLVNPYEAMTRALGNSIKGRWMGDYKSLAVEHWVESFKNLLKTSKEELRTNPLYHMVNPEYNNAVADNAAIRTAEAARQRIMNFIGYQSDMGKDMTYLENKILDAIDHKAGKEWRDYVQTRVLEKIRDPVTHARAFAFHLNLGIFNPVSFMVQAQTLTNVMSIAPTHAFQSLAAGFIQRAMLRTEDPTILSHYAKMVKHLGWNEADLLESFNALKRIGYHEVGGEVAWKDSIAELKSYQSAVGSFLDKGTMFFNEGERTVRMTAWNVAYREWKKANPKAILDDAAIGKILNRADDLGVNMTRASNAAWNNGIWSIPTQYFSYQARLMEQIIEGTLQTGAKKLSRAETGRLMAGLSLMYGIPVGAGAALGFFPVYDDIKNLAREKGINMNDNFLKIATDGLGAFSLGLVTGQDFDVAQRYGPGGNDAIVQIFKGNKKWYEILGASSSTMASVLGTMYPFLKAAWSSTIGDGSYPITMDDFIDASREIKSVNNVAKMLYAVNTHKYVTKNQTVVTDVSNTDAVFMGLFGLTPRNIKDTFSAKTYEKELREAKDSLKPEIIKQLRLATDAYARGEDDTGQRHFKRYQALIEGAGLTWQERIQVFNQGLDRNETAMQQIIRRQMTRKATTVK